MPARSDLRHLTALFDRLQGEIEAPVLLRCLNLATEHYLTVDPARALDLADALVVGAAWAGDARSGALGLLGRGDALRRLGRLLEAVAVLDEAGIAFRALPGSDEVGWARTRIGWVVARHALGEWHGVPETIVEAMRVFTEHGEWLRAVKLATNVGVIHFERAEYAPALGWDDDALAYCRQLAQEEVDVQLLAARIRSNRALVLAELGDFDAALAELDAARELFAEHGQADSALAQALNIAYVRRSIGDYAAALAQLDAVVRAAERDGHAWREASARHEQGLIYLELGDCTAALRRAEVAYQGYHTLEGESATAAEVLVLCAEIQSTLGDLDEAHELLGVADTLGTVPDGLASNERARLRAAIALARAELHLAEADMAGAESDAGWAAATFDELGRRHDAARAELVRARALFGLGRVAEAARQAEALLADASLVAGRRLVAPGHHLLAMAALAEGNRLLATEHLATAIAALESLVGPLAPNLRSAIQASQHIYRDAIDLQIAVGAVPAAYDLLERSKSPALLARLTGASLLDGRPSASEDPRRAERLRRYHYQSSQMQRLASEPDSAANKARIARLRLAVRALESELADQQLPAPAPSVASREALATEDLTMLLPPDAVLVEYYLAADHGAAFVLTREQGLTCHTLDLDRRRVDDLVVAWRHRVAQLQLARTRPGAQQTVTASEGDLRRLSKSLYDALVTPIAKLFAGRRQLVIVPYGPLHALPFAALHDGEHYLAERHDIAVAPSGAVLRHCLLRRAPDTGPAIVLGNDWHGRLPSCHAEATAIAEILGCHALIGDAATMAAFGTASGSGCAVLHLAAHGEARLDNPLFAYVALADGHLTALAAMDLSLAGALVTLSACETGLGGVTGGDEVMGLSAAFLAAGATAVVHSLWRVDDQLTAQLMVDFYRQLRAGATVAAALRSAQRACLAEPGASVVDWAPYQVVGNGLLRLPAALV